MSKLISEKHEAVEDSFLGGLERRQKTMRRYKEKIYIPIVNIRG
jgi:hypothetical protein